MIEIFQKFTDKEGRPTFTQHRVWDGPRFKQNRHDITAKDGGSYEFLSKEQYEAATGKKVWA